MYAENGDAFGCENCSTSNVGSNRRWIECKSQTFPGRIYYFNTMTGCSTWRRPVPRDTRLPRYAKFQHSKIWESPPNGEELLPVNLALSKISESAIFGSENPPTEFELHTRRMEIYFKKNVDCYFDIRDELLGYYKKAKSELSKRLCERQGKDKRTLKLNNIKQNVKPIKATKIIRECHGIKTVSYDPVPRELPPGVNILNLSDTSVDSSNPVPAIEQPINL